MGWRGSCGWDRGVVLTLPGSGAKHFLVYFREVQIEFCGASDSLDHRSSRSPGLFRPAWVRDLCPLVVSVYAQTIATYTFGFYQWQRPRIHHL